MLDWPCSNIDMPHLISVITTVLNGQLYLPTAIDSILNQSFSDFEYFIIDDGSTDDTMQIIKKYAAMDARIVPIFNEKNLGQSRSRNKAIELANGEFIAIMDADDISLPSRLETQVRYLQAHPTVGLVGGLALEINSKVQSFGKIRGEIRSEAECFWAEISRVASSVIHPTVMVRKSIMDTHQLRYNPKTLYAQDKELWSRLLLVSEGVVLPKCLLQYRVHDNSISSSKTVKQREYALGAVVRMVRTFLGDESVLAETIEQMVSIGPSFTPEVLPAWELRLQILESMEKSGRFDHYDILGIRAMEVIRFKKWGSVEAVRQGSASGLLKRFNAGVTPPLLLKVVCKSLLKKVIVGIIARSR